MKQIPDITSLSLEQKIGQVLCFGWQGDTHEEMRSFNAHTREIVAEMGVGSVVLMTRNLHDSDPLQTRNIVAELQSHAHIPTFIAVDQEGGSVNRFRSPFHEFPGNMALGAIAKGTLGLSGGEMYTEKQAEAQARELLSVGVNWNFAPVADVNNNPDNPIIGVRSFGEDPQITANLVCAAIRGYQKSGMLACAKHFPGHGDTNVDSHLALPAVDGDLNRMNSVELVPFNAAIVQSVGAIMTSHILFRHLDPERPATLSKTILTNLLRKSMGYDGLVITDCLEMEAIAGTIGTAQGAVAALRAGADIVLVCHTLITQRETVQAIRNAVSSGELPESRLNEAVTRVLAAKQRFLVNSPEPGGEPWLNPEHHLLEESIAQASITVVEGLDRIPVGTNSDILLVSMHPAVHQFANSVRRHTSNVKTLQLDPKSVDDLELCALENYSTVVILTCPVEPWTAEPIDQERQARMVKFFHLACDTYEVRMVVAAIKEPYDIRIFSPVPSYVCTYGHRKCSLDALADMLFGVFAPTAALPVNIPAS